MKKSISIDLPYVEKTLKTLISINSVLPNELKIAEFIADEIRSFGIEPEWHEVAPGRPNVYANAYWGKSGRYLVFSGHSDTVDASKDWETNPFETTIKDGRLYGLGAINMKSGLACMLGAFKAIVEGGDSINNSGKLGLAICVDQEGHSHGARALLDTEYGKCDAMLHAEHFFGDSSDDYLPNAVTGKVLYKLSVHGKAAHAFRPYEGGINAVVDASRIVTALENIEMKKDPVLGTGTICVLKIDGGYEEYSIVVPEQCQIVITRLTVPGETVESSEKDMRNLIKQLNLDSSVDIEMSPPCYEPYFLDDDTPILPVFKNVYHKTTGSQPVFAPHRGIVDANIFSGEGGIPTVVFGPKGKRHHEAGEYVELSSLKPVTEIYVQTALAFLGEESSE
jgi:acetylornithine deacetylase/succinyl-diaminopimelate desuccinylase-like protein